jgi:hypothetical protein
MNRTLTTVALMSLMAAGAAFGQNAATNSSPNPPAVTSGDAAAKTSAAPVAGRNSFTEKQAAERLQEHGYSSVQGLTKDDQGIWHGSATKSGAKVNVTLDYQGNISEQ